MNVRGELWGHITYLNNLDCTGLLLTSIIRLKLFTLNRRLIINTLGYLSNQDKADFNNNLPH